MKNNSSLARGILLLNMLFTCAFALAQQGTFTDVTDSAGIKHVFKVYEGLFGGGACAFDFNNDGWDDVYITGGMNDDILYKNNGDGTFSNVTDQAGLSLTRQFVTQGVVSADVNRDGFADLFITTITSRVKKEKIPRAINLLFLNNGNGTFRDATAAFGLDQMYSFSTGAAFGDFNADGWPDIYVGNYFNEFQGNLTALYDDADIVASSQIAKGYLLLNEGGKKFKDVYSEYGLDYKGYGFGGVFTDFDNDGDQDLFITHDFGYKRTPDLLLENLYPRKKFQDEAPAYHMDLQNNSMGTAVGDVNGDGFMDYFITNIDSNYFMVSQGKGKPFLFKTRELGMDLYTISWGANFADFDQDGDLDLFVANGDLNPNCHPMGNFYFENLGDRFQNMAREKKLDDYGIGRGSITFDYDNDGDLDILLVNQEAVLAYPTPSYTRLYRNDLATGNWIKIALKGVQAESHGIGSKIEIEAGGKKMIREISGGASGHISQNSVIAHFGLGKATTIDRITVYWTGGNKQTITNVKANQLLTITEIPEEKNESILIYIITAGVLLLAAGFFLLRKRKSS